MFLTALTFLALGAPPSPEAVKSVFDHFYTGTEVVVAEVFLCKDIEVKDKEHLYDCNVTFEDKAAKGDKVAVYVIALVPRSVEKELTIQALHDGVVRTTKDMVLKGNKNLPRKRRYARFVVSKPGNWSFIVRDGSQIIEQKTLFVEE